jgi:hypothetical protein
VKDTHEAMNAKFPATALFYSNGTFLERSNWAHARAASLLQHRFQRGRQREILAQIGPVFGAQVRTMTYGLSRTIV